MSYRHVPKLPSTSDTPDTLALSQALQTPVSMLGELDAHNLDAVSVRTGATPDRWLWHKMAQVSALADPLLVAGAGPSSVAGAAISNCHDWETVATLTVNTGQSRIVLFASVVGALTPWAPTVPTVAASAEVAISVDGAIIEISSTRKHEGSLLRNYCPVAPQATMTAALGPQVVRYSFADAIGPALWHARIITSYACQPGSHSVSLLVRRVRSSTDMTHPSTTLRAYLRRLLVMEIPAAPVITDAPQSVSVAPIATGDTLSAAALSTDRLAPSRNAVNTIETGDIRAGGLVHPHFPTSIRAASQTTILTGSSLPRNVALYPGFGSSTITPLAPPPATGWYLVDNGAGVFLSDTNGGAGWSTSTWGKVYILVTAHLHITMVHDNGVAPGLNHIAAVTLMYRRADTGAWVQLGATPGECEAYCHSCNYSSASVASPFGATPRDEPIEQTMSLYGWRETGGNLAYNISEIGVFVSTVDALGTGVGPAVQWDRGSVQVLVMREA